MFPLHLFNLYLLSFNLLIVNIILNIHDDTSNIDKSFGKTTLFRMTLQRPDKSEQVKN